LNTHIFTGLYNTINRIVKHFFMQN